MEKEIYFDMDGTIADLYSDPDWLAKLRAFDPSPYVLAAPLLNMSRLARLLHRAQKHGYKVFILSWRSMDTNDDYDEAVTNAKLDWLARHLPSVEWDGIFITAYGVPKHSIGSGILFDDNKAVREGWGEGAYTPDEIWEILAEI